MKRQGMYPVIPRLLFSWCKVTEELGVGSEGKMTAGHMVSGIQARPASRVGTVSESRARPLPTLHTVRMSDPRAALAHPAWEVPWG